MQTKSLHAIHMIDLFTYFSDQPPAESPSFETLSVITELGDSGREAGRLAPDST